MGFGVLAIALAAVSDCGVERVVPDATHLSGERCFDWSGADAEDPELQKIYGIYQRMLNFSLPDGELVNPVSNWDSARLTTVAVNIILKEIIGYDSKLDFIGSTGMLYECVADGTHTFNLETWVNTKADQRNTWVADKVRGETIDSMLTILKQTNKTEPKTTENLVPEP
jgi:hypothetical protein